MRRHGVLWFFSLFLEAAYPPKSEDTFKHFPGRRRSRQNLSLIQMLFSSPVGIPSTLMLKFRLKTYHVFLMLHYRVY
jgi:hypothetical protein